MSRPTLADDLREALRAPWDGPPVYVVVPPTLTLETERAVFAATGLRGSFRLRVVDWNGLARGVLKSAGKSVGAPLTQEAWRLLVMVRLHAALPGGGPLPGLVHRIADTLWDAFLAQPTDPGCGLGDVFPPPYGDLLTGLVRDLEPALARLAHPARVALFASRQVRAVSPTVFILEDPEPNPFRDILGPAVLSLPGVRPFGRQELFGDAPFPSPLETGEGLTVAQAAHPLAEAWLVAARSRDLIAAGADPGHIAVTSPRIRTYVPHLRRAFSEAALAADILPPAGLYGAESRLLTGLLRLGRRPGAERRRILADLASTGLLPRLGAAVLPSRRSTARLERLMRDQHGPLAGILAFGREAQEGRPLSDHLARLGRLLEAEGVQAEVARHGDTEAWDALMESLLEASDTLGEAPLPSRLARDILMSTLRSARRPHPIPHHGAVGVVDLEQALASPIRHLFVLGLTDRSLTGSVRRGLLPRAGAPADHPLLRLWRERQAWDQGVSDRLRQIRGQTLGLFFPVDDGEGGRSEPALLVAEATERFPESIFPAPTDPVALALSKPDLASSLALSIAEGRRLGRPAAFEEGLAGCLATMGGVGEALSALAPPEPEGRLAPEVAGRLFDQFSVSSLEARAACPTKHLAHALGLKDQADDPLHVTRWGERAHKVLQDLMKEVMEGEGPPEPASLAARARELARAAVEDEVDGLLPGKRRDGLGELLALALERTAGGIAMDLATGGFAPIKAETCFGRSGESEVRLAAKGEALPLTGRIDRVDRRPDGSLRLVDYKTGRAEIDYVRLYHGLDLQLALYAVAAEATGLGRATRLTLWPVTSARVRVALPGGKASRHPERPGELNLEEEPLTLHLVARAIRIAGKLAAEARSGVVAPRPVRLGRHLACEACSLRPVCRAETPEAKRLPTMTRGEVLAALGGGEA